MKEVKVVHGTKWWRCQHSDMHMHRKGKNRKQENHVKKGVIFILLKIHQNEGLKI